MHAHSTLSEEMKKFIGIICFLAGLVGSLIFGLDAYQKTESIKIFGSSITLSQADWNPFIVSLGVLIIGIILIVTSKTAKATRGTKKKR